MAILNRKNVDDGKKNDIAIALWEFGLIKIKEVQAAIKEGEKITKEILDKLNSRNGEGS
jgi:RNA-binding protein YhbY